MYISINEEREINVYICICIMYATGLYVDPCTVMFLCCSIHVYLYIIALDIPRLVEKKFVA